MTTANDRLTSRITALETLLISLSESDFQQRINFIAEQLSNLRLASTNPPMTNPQAQTRLENRLLSLESLIATITDEEFTQRADYLAGQLAGLRIATGQLSGGPSSSSALPIVQVSGVAKTLELSDANTYQNCINQSALTITIPLQSQVNWAANTEIFIARNGQGNITIAAPSINGEASVSLTAPYSAAIVKRIASDSWISHRITETSLSSILTDPDVIAYRDAHTLLSSTLTPTELSAVTAFVQGAKARNLWSIEEFYLPLGTTLAGKLLRLKPLFGMTNNGFVLNDFTPQGLVIGGANTLTSTVVGVGLNAVSFGVYVNRASGLGAPYAWLGQGTNGVQITTTTNAAEGGHGLYSNISFSNQRLTPSQVGFFSGSFSGPGSQRIPYINGVAGTGGPGGSFNSPNIGLRLLGGGQTRISGAFATSRSLTAEDQAGLNTLFQNFMTATGQAA